MMMAAPPQVVGVLLKKPGQRERDDLLSNPRVPPLDSQEIKIRGELYVEDLGEQRMVTIRMGWLWVEGTPMRLPLRALNLRQAAPSHCQPHVSALGFTLSNPQNGTLATFWADTEPIYWSWVRAIAAELVRQTPFRAQRSLNFLEILTICPRGPVPLPESPTELRRRSRSELRSWFRNYSIERPTDRSSGFDDSRRRARSELRGWSSNSSDEDVLGEFRTIPDILAKEPTPPRPWAFSESSEGSDDSLPWGGGGQSSVDSVDSVNGVSKPVIPEPETREQRIQRYKEARRRENEARSRRVVEEDARRRKARAEENNNNNNNNNVTLAKLTKVCHSVSDKNRETETNNNNNDHNRNNNKNNNNNNNNNNSNKNHNIVFLTSLTSVGSLLHRRNGSTLLPTTQLNQSEKLAKDSSLFPFLLASRSPRLMRESERGITEFDKSSVELKPIGNFVRFEEQRNSTNSTNLAVLQSKSDPAASERRSRARERRSVREQRAAAAAQGANSLPDSQVETLRERKERLAALSSRIPVPNLTHLVATSLPESSIIQQGKETARPKSPPSFTAAPGSVAAPEPCEEAVARLLKRCQRVDHYVPVRDKLTLFESLSRLGGRLARSTEDLGRAKAIPTSPRGKQRARSLHDLNRATKSLPVREMCRFFEGERYTDDASPIQIQRATTATTTRFSGESIVTPGATRLRTWSDGNVVPTFTNLPLTLTSATKKSPTKSTGRRRQYAK